GVGSEIVSKPLDGDRHDNSRATTPAACPCLSSIFFYNPPPSTEIYTLSLHDALPILKKYTVGDSRIEVSGYVENAVKELAAAKVDRKSTRLNSSHVSISYAVFCLKKKNGNPECLTISALD